MTAFEKWPGLKDILDKCIYECETLIGKKVSVKFSLKFHHLTTEQLATIICDVCEVKWEQVISESRKASIILARHLFCYFAFTVQKKTLWEIAHIIHRTDHSTIVHARDKVKKMIETNDEMYMPAFQAVEDRINEIVTK